MARLLTEQEVYSIGGSGGYTTNLLCTYARAQAMGCTANGVSLASNQLVWEGSVRQACNCLRQGEYDNIGWGTMGYRWYNDCSYTVMIYWTQSNGTNYSSELCSGCGRDIVASAYNIYCT